MYDEMFHKNVMLDGSDMRTPTIWVSGHVTC